MEPRTAESTPQIVDGVLVVGAGYAGLHAARQVRRAGVPVTVVDQDGRHDFVTRLAAVAGGTAPAGDAGVAVEAFVSDTIPGRVVTVADGVVGLADGRSVTADAVIVTVGSIPSSPPVDGIELALGLRTTADALAVRSRLDETDQLIVIGGGATGAQLAGSVAHHHPACRVHLVEQRDHLLAELDRPLQAGAERILTARGVVLHLGQEIDQVTDDGVVVGGESLDGLVVWAGGFTPDTGAFGLPTDEDGRICIDSELLIEGFERTFAAGDVAAHRTRQDEPLAMSAQIAVQAGEAAGRNAAALVAGVETSSADLRQKGWVLDLGGRRGVAQIGPISLAGPGLDLVPPLLHHAIDLKTLIGEGGLGGLRHAPRGLLHLIPGR